jgi:murein DD-endopeptidase MepM/ murein hydrolase activator NlpD
MSGKESGAMTRVTSRKTNIIILLLLIVAIGGVAAFIRLFEKEVPQVELLKDIDLLGPNTTVGFAATDAKSGLREIEMYLRQGEKSASIFHKTFQQTNILLNKGPRKIEESPAINIQALGFKDGPAELEISARDFSWTNWRAGNILQEKIPLTIDTQPPRISIIYAPRYISPGGSGMVIYRLSEESDKHGVDLNGHFNPGFPVTQPPDGRFVSYFGLPFDLDKFEQCQVSAVDKAINAGRTSFSMILKKVRYKHDQITVSEDFLTRKLPEFKHNYPELNGTLLEQYLYVNNTVRQKNSDTIAAICQTSQPWQLWQDRFMRMEGSSRKAGYADHRTYNYAGKEIDQQVHLGIDLASTSRALVEAANRGVVVFADYLGIYGNTVILDHGQGVFSLYAHLSQLDVAVNDLVEKNARLGLSGASGMAGGDHLHFSMLVNGIFVNPLEWWDNQWLKLNITDQL